MIKYFLKLEDKQIIVNFCNHLINNIFNIKEIINNIGLMANVCLKILPPLIDEDIYESNRISILIDDILEMESINQQEKEEAILELIVLRKFQLQALAKQILNKLEDDMREAEERGFCQRLLNNDNE